MVTTNAGNGNSNENRPRSTRGVEGEKKEKRIYTTDNRGNDRPRSNFKRDGQSREIWAGFVGSFFIDCPLVFVVYKNTGRARTRPALA